MYRGRKFNSKKENVKGDKAKYLGIQRFRFYIKCTVCSRPITFLTDPKNADYEMESGATRNYEVHKDKERTDEEMAAERAAEEKEDPMKALENRVMASQREMQEMDALEEIRALNMKHRQMMSGGAAGGASSAAASGTGGSGGDVSAILDAREAAAARAAAQEEELTETDIYIIYIYILYIYIYIIYIPVSLSAQSFHWPVLAIGVSLQTGTFEGAHEHTFGCLSLE